MSADELRQKISETTARLDAIDAERREAVDNRQWPAIGPLDAEREHLEPVLQSLTLGLTAQLQLEQDAAKIDLGPRIVNEYKQFHQANCEALDGAVDALEALKKANAMQTQFVRWATESMQGAGEGHGITLGPPVAAVRLSGETTRIEKESRFLVASLCAVLSDIFRSLGDAPLADLLKTKSRAGTALAR